MINVPIHLPVPNFFVPIYVDTYCRYILERVFFMRNRNAINTLLEN